MIVICKVIYRIYHFHLLIDCMAAKCRMICALKVDDFYSFSILGDDTLSSIFEYHCRFLN